MATPPEKKALVFFGALALLGGGVRAWRAYHRPLPNSEDNDYVHYHSSPQDVRHKGRYSKNGRSKKKPLVDTMSTIDLDRATLADVEALGVVKPGVARMIVADRDSFGPFGSIQELERVPYLSWYDIRRLASRVTFSMLPRPRNTVIHGRPEPSLGRRKRHLSSDLDSLL